MFRELSADLLGRGLSIRFRVDGASMRPTLRSGDIVTITPVSRRRPNAGDIVLACVSERLFVHRVVAIETWNGTRIYYLRGDACSGPGEIVDEAAILGVR